MSAAFLAAVHVDVHADERHFTYTYEPKVLPAGALEFEQWTTLRAGKEDGIYSRWDLRSEFEYGITDALTSALYINFKSLHIDRDSEQEDEFEFSGLSSEWKYKLLDPTADPLGVVLYGEVSTDLEELELEQKLIVGKNIGDWIFAFNAIVEEEWEFEREGTEKKLELEFTAGAAYQVTDRFSIGLEVRQANEFPDMDSLEHSALFAGPAIHYSTDDWWLTLTVLPQIVAFEGTTGDSLNLDEFDRVSVRLLIGIPLD